MSQKQELTQHHRINLNHIVHQGYLGECTNKRMQGWRNVWGVISENYLFVFNDKDTVSPRTIVEKYDLRIYTKISSIDITCLIEQYAFYIKKTSSKDKIVFYTMSQEDTTTWINSMKVAAKYVKPKPRPKPTKEIVELVKESNIKKEFHAKNYISFDKLNTKEYKIKKEKAKIFTNNILSKPCSGNPNDKNTLLHVLAGFSKSQGKECIFTQDDSNKNSKFIGSIGDSSKNQNCVLALDSLDDVCRFNNTCEEIKVNDNYQRENKLKKQIMNLKNDLKNNKKNKTIENLKIKLGKAHGVDPKYIRINDIYYGSAHIDYDIITSFSKKGNVTQALKDQFKAYKDLKLHPLFFEESFNIKDFDDRGHKKFDNGSEFDVGPSGRTQKYRQPSGWTRYGLKVLDGRYGTNDKWLHPFQDPGNWYRAYHGTGANIGKLIVNGPNNNQDKAFFKTGSGQACRSNPAHCGGVVGIGVYCSPDPKIAESYCKNHVTIQTNQGPKTFKFMFQICVDPNVVRISTTTKDYWVVPDGQTQDAMRPYGILLKQI